MSAPVARLTLYLAGDSPASRRARANLAAALAERIYVTPALLLQVAAQREMLVGDLSQHEAVVATLAALAPDTPDTPGNSRSSA